MKRPSLILLIMPIAFVIAACAHTATHEKTASPSPKAVSDAIHSMTGCYLVDYSYVEMEPLKKGYKRDARVYDVNKTKSVKEWIYADDTSPTNIRLQHILFAADDKGKFVSGSELKHQAEDWEYQAPVVYEFTRPSTWKAVPQPAGSEKWTRKITNLDDGLRYQCASNWKFDSYPEWSCDNYAPIPGRETRDMQRKDYNTLERSTRVVAYGSSWLERQSNTKVEDKNGKQTPLVKETGKTWYVRLPDSECREAKAFAEPRQEFWALLKDTWNDVYKEGKPFVEKPTVKGTPPRFAKMGEVEDAYVGKDLSNPTIRKQAREAILKVIADYRLENASGGAATKSSY